MKLHPVKMMVGILALLRLYYSEIYCRLGTYVAIKLVAASYCIDTRVVKNDI